MKRNGLGLFIFLLVGIWGKWLIYVNFLDIEIYGNGVLCVED
jgi:hypothetical protein